MLHEINYNNFAKEHPTRGVAGARCGGRAKDAVRQPDTSDHLFRNERGQDRTKVNRTDGGETAATE